MSTLKKFQGNREEETCDVRVLHLDRIARAKSEAVSEPALDRMALMYRLLGDPTRLKMMMALRNEEMCVCYLAAFTGLTESAVSHQLRRLRELSIVKKRREGQVLYYSLDDHHIAALVEAGLVHVLHKAENEK